ncbi:MAG: SMC-Scp complex subunit ScpB [bacterium]|nr:SMC-Scp complex subunit ScpB [bacterium]MDI1337645.1 SMC-Scp complex subunit ScpB [Lacunisphaera sp.]
MAFDLKRVLKVMLFASNGPLSVKDIQTAIIRFHEQATVLPLTEDPTVASPEAGASAEAGPAEPEEPVLPAPVEDDEFYRDVPSLVTTAEIREAMDGISLELQAAASEILLVEGHSGWRLATHPRFARWVRLLRNEPPPVRLSPSSLETLAVIAYRQPVTRAEIEQIRGVSADAGLAKLLERDLVYIVGRADLPGRPIQYGTTEAFLEFTGIKSIDELPSSDVLSPRQIDAWLQTSNQPRAASDADMGLDETEQTQMSLEQPAKSETATP